MRNILEIKYDNREKDDMDDFIIDGELSIEELYYLAKKDGFEKRNLYFKLKEEGNRMSDTIYADYVMAFGKGWTKDTCIMTIKYKKEVGEYSCSG
jgi:hypothetical protein